MFFKTFAEIIFKRKRVLLLLIIVASLYALYFAIQVRPAHNALTILPEKDEIFKKYLAFKEKFGEEDNTLFVGIQTKDLFEPQFLNDWRNLTDSLKKIKHIKSVVSLTHFYEIKKDTLNKKFKTSLYKTPKQFDAQKSIGLKNKVNQLPFYNHMLWDLDRNTTLINLILEKGIGKSTKRNVMIKEIEKFIKIFNQTHSSKVYLSGLPVIRTKVSEFVINEFIFFLCLTVILSILILYLFFRNFSNIFFPILSVLLGVIWCLAFMDWFDYDLTLLTGLIPPLIVIIGIPNSILIQNKYKTEWLKHKNKNLTLKETIRIAGFSTFLANFTTAIGFFVLYFTGSQLLEQFGLIASISVMVTWLISLIVIYPMFHVTFKASKNQHIQSFHSFPFLIRFLSFVNHSTTTLKGQKNIFLFVGIMVIIALFGIYKLKVESYVIDDLSDNNPIKTNINFFENNFQGIVPLEIMIDTQQKKGVENMQNLRIINGFEEAVSAYPFVSNSLSINQGFKFITQAFYNDNPAMYRMPSNFEQNFILSYLKKSKTENELLDNFIDEKGSSTRLSFRMYDIGTQKLKVFYEDLDSLSKEYFPEKFKVEITGTSKIFLHGTTYLVDNLKESLLLAILIIASLMWYFFKSYKMIIVATLPNLIPLGITAGIMGYFGVPISPSTILIFSIALGIASDQTIYFLSKLKANINQSSNQIQNNITEVGVSMAYITFLLLLGFGIFLFSKFEGTVYLGLLLSLTIFSTFFSNIFFLPAMIRFFKIRI